MAIPLKYFTELPDAAVDLAATFNHARYMGWINLGGNRRPLHGVDSIGIRMRKPIHNPMIEIRSIMLAREDSGDAYMGEVPAVDEFGQSNPVDSAIFSGCEITPYYDSMLAKLIVYAENREEAIHKMRSALGEVVIEGIDTNIDYEYEIINDSKFISGNFDVDFIEKFNRDRRAVS